jgi:predicted nucleic acid-binding protein
MIFVDTGAWVAIEDKRDANHEKVEVFAFDRHFEQMGFFRKPQ